MDNMIGYAHSSLHHWKLYSGGTIVNVQRGEYMIAKAYALTDKKDESRQCFDNKMLIFHFISIIEARLN